jgi:hypothetical protein
MGCHETIAEIRPRVWHMKLMLAPPSSDDLVQLLRAWRFWLLGAVVGALAGAAAYYVVPPPYRARATVNVDFHLEQAWPQNSDREQFYYLERETRKLEEVAFSDAALGAAAAAVPGVTVKDLRAGKLNLGQPGNGGWHFYADDKDPGTAASLASAWALAFASQVQKQVIASSTSGLEPYITADPVQTENVPARHAVSLAIYLLAGTILVLVVETLSILFLDAKQ